MHTMPTVFITGAGRGLGLELARQYAADGWQVVGTVREPAAAAALSALGARALTLDVADLGAVSRLRDELRGAPIDVLLCNAGISGKRGMALGSFDYGEWEKVLRVNLLGAAAVIEALVDNVAASARRTIAIMSSRMGSISGTTGATLPYSTSKAALNLLARGLSATLASRGIIVLALHPGWVRTDMGGASAPLTPKESVRGIRRVLDGLRQDDSGKFLSYDGTAIPW